MASSVTKPVLIVGGGLAGLACAWRLTRLGRACEIVEASDAVGGRVRTDIVGGCRLDRGFQVLLTAYPNTASVVDFASLDLREFNAGAIVRVNGTFHRAFDPLRHPTESLATALTPIVTVADKVRLGKLWAEVLANSPEQLLHGGPERTTEAELHARGFSELAMRAFFRPFFGGIFLQQPLTTSARFFRYTFRMFATGRAAVPAAGMGEIPKQIADELIAAGVRIRLSTRVTERSPGAVTIVTDHSGERLSADIVVVATNLPDAKALLPDLPDLPTGASRSACTVYFAADHPVVGGKTLVLNGDGGVDGPVNHLAEMSAVAPDYAPPGKTLISASVLEPDRYADDDELQAAVRIQLSQWVGPAARVWSHLRTDRIAHALPPADPPTLAEPRWPVKLADGLFVCGDHRDQPSIEGAITSGLRTADAIVGADEKH